MRIPTRAASSLAIAALLVSVTTALTAAPAQAAATRSCLPASLQTAHATSASRAAAVAPVYFEMRTIENAPFAFQLTDPAKIEHEVAPA
ncbi:hypothetical protein AB0F17_40395 [Nonomuraea sp. NPDC026600]|uniref:hypothetical protein n=1 Tax=Nonomuraea sp. NPDC026600 TaxID=3155363 RepID=UPI0033FE7C8A